MRLKKSRSAAQDEITSFVNAGYALLTRMRADYSQKRSSNAYNCHQDNAIYREWMNAWAKQVRGGLGEIFPTERESHAFFNAPNVNTSVAHGMNVEFGGLYNRTQDLIAALERVLDTGLNQYTDLPIKDRLFVEDIDSFAKVRDVNPAMVSQFLDEGCLNLSEDAVKAALEQILHVPFHRKDSPAELDDVYTANVVVNGARRATAFMLKGPGIKVREMDVKHCGLKGNQLVRLFDAPADLFLVQFTGRIAEMVIKDVEGKVAALRARGKEAHYVIMDGQDTARVLHAYGKL